jgi:hypothetical protein
MGAEVGISRTEKEIRQRDFGRLKKQAAVGLVGFQKSQRVYQENDTQGMAGRSGFLRKQVGEQADFCWILPKTLPRVWGYVCTLPGVFFLFPRILDFGLGKEVVF